MADHIFFAQPTRAFLLSKTVAVCFATAFSSAVSAKSGFFWGLTELSDLDYLADNPSVFETGNPFLLKDLTLLDDIPVEHWNLSATDPLRFGSVLTSDASGVPIINLSVDPGKVMQVDRDLDLRVYSELSNKVTATALFNGQNSQKLVFNSDVAISVLFKEGSSGSAPAVDLTGRSQTIFHSGLHIFSQGCQGPLLNLRDRSNLILSGLTEIRGDSALMSVRNSVLESNRSLTLISTGSDSALINDGTIRLQGDFRVEGKDLLRGTGTIEVSGPSSSVFLKGNLLNYNGSYTQVGGEFRFIGESEFTADRWQFRNTQIYAEAKNLFTVSPDQYDGKLLQGTIRADGGTIVITDERIDLNYLSEAALYYGDSIVTYSGELFIDGNKQSFITLENHFGLLDQTNIGLASVTLQLGETSKLEGKNFHIGSLYSSKDTLLLSNSNVVLYGAGRGTLTGAIDWVAVGNGSSLEIHGLKYQGTRENIYRAALSSSLYIYEGGKVLLKGNTDVFQGADIVNNGTFILDEGALMDTFGDFYQTSGSTDIGKGARFLSANSVQILGGSMEVLGTLRTKEFVASGSSVTVAGTVMAENFTLGSRGAEKSSTSELIISNGAEVEFSKAVTGSSDIVINGDKEKGIYSSLTLRNWDGSGTRISVKENGILILGDSGASENIDTDFVHWASSITDNKLSATLAVSATVAISSANRITVGNHILGKSENSPLYLGSDSSLLIKPRLGGPAFTAADAHSGIEFGKGSKIMVVDPFGVNQLTDASLENISGIDSVTLLSANRRVSLVLSQNEGGWFIERDKTGMTEEQRSQFIYPQLQGWLYDNPEGFTLDSENLAQRFFARADNDQYMGEEYSAAMIGQATQLGALLGNRLNIVRSGTDLIQSSLNESAKILENGHRGTYMFGGVTGGYFISKDRGDYLKNATYKSSSEAVTLGIAHLAESGVAYTGAFSATRYSNKTRGTIVPASGNQYIFGISGSVAKKFSQTIITANIGLGYSRDKISASLPESMQMDSLKGKINGYYVTAGAEVAHPVTDRIQAVVGTRLWALPENTEKTSFSSQSAFELKNRNQVFGEIPISLRVRSGESYFYGAKVELGGEIGASVRAGQLEKKGTLRAVGTQATEKISQRELSRWNAFAGANVSVTKGKMSASLQAKASTGDGKVDGRINLKTTWMF